MVALKIKIKKGNLNGSPEFFPNFPTPTDTKKYSYHKNNDRHQRYLIWMKSERNQHYQDRKKIGSKSK